jgi:hypothetical protein
MESQKRLDDTCQDKKEAEDWYKSEDAETLNYDEFNHSLSVCRRKKQSQPFVVEPSSLPFHFKLYFDQLSI